jgi:hypothetical protein
MKWEKRGRLFGVSGNAGWMHTHAQVPTVLVQEDRLRVYFATRPKPGLSLTTFVDLDRQDPHRVLYVHDKPILELGKPGAFDEHGVMPSYVCENEGQVWLYYAGWSRRESIRYSNWTGLAYSDDGGMTFERRFAGPVLDRTPYEIYSATGCFIIREGGDWHMWYASGVEWLTVNDQFEEYYVIKHASSGDGIHWDRENRKLLPSKRPYEPTHTPTVLRKDGRYHMWFCHRSVEDFRDGGGSYRMGYAWSDDRKNWQREDENAGITVSSDGWDSKMVAYPYVAEVDGQAWMFYNGNGFGQSGFGYAVLAD